MSLNPGLLSLKADNCWPNETVVHLQLGAFDFTWTPICNTIRREWNNFCPVLSLSMGKGLIAKDGRHA